MNLQAVLAWLFSSAGAGWVFGILAALGALLGWIIAWWRRERPPRVIVQEIDSIRLVDIHPSQRHRLEILFTDDDGSQIPLYDLQQKEIVIYNNGTRDILEPLKLTLGFREPSSDETPRDCFWRWFFDEGTVYRIKRLEEIAAVIGSDYKTKLSHGISIELPHLNSYPVHGDFFRAYLISDREIELGLWGKESGKGWSARFVTLDQARKVGGRVGTMIAIPSIVLLSSGAFVVGGILRDWEEKTGSEGFTVFDIGFLLSLLVFAGVVGVMFGPIRRKLSDRWLGALLPSEFKQASS